MDYAEISRPYRYREWGDSLAALANRLGISPAGVGYAVQRGEAIAHENGYQLIQCYIDFFKGVPQYIGNHPTVKSAGFEGLAFDGLAYWKR